MMTICSQSQRRRISGKAAKRCTAFLLATLFLTPSLSACSSSVENGDHSSISGCDASEWHPDRYRVNLVFGFQHRRYREIMGYYIPLPTYPGRVNQHGIIASIYERLLFYTYDTGVELSYEDAVAFFDEGCEPDGSVRMLRSGLHPEIEAFVDWYSTLPDAFGLGSTAERSAGQFQSRLSRAYLRQLELRGYDWESLPRGGAVPRSILGLSPDALRALVRMISDPDYDIDFDQFLVRGAHWDYLWPTYLDYLQRVGIDIDSLPPAPLYWREPPLTSSIEGLVNPILYRLWRYYEGHDEVLDLSPWHPSGEADE